MTDETIMLDTLKFIDRETQPPSIYVNISDTIWWNFDVQKKEHLRRLLYKGLANQNMDNRWEFRLTADGDFYIENGYKELKKDFLKFVQKQPDIELFMVDHFIKPNPKLTTTKHETDNGVIFLKSLKKDGLINFDKGDLLHINGDWYEENPPINKRWFDTVDKNHPFLVELTELGKNYLLFGDEIQPIMHTPMQPINAQIKTIHKGIGNRRNWKSEFMVGFIYAILALTIGTILLRIFGVI